METVIFWIAWGLISFWVLKTFYHSFNKRKLESLRKAAFGINLAVLTLIFLPWLPQSLGGESGFTIAMEGNILAVSFLFFLIISIILFLTKTPTNLKIASVATIANTLILFVLMMQIRPGTFTLTLFDIAPIIAFMLLLVNDIVVLFLWQQLQLMKNKSFSQRKLILFFSFAIAFFTFISGSGVQAQNKSLGGLWQNSSEGRVIEIGGIGSSIDGIVKKASDSAEIGKSYIKGSITDNIFEGRVYLKALARNCSRLDGWYPATGEISKDGNTINAHWKESKYNIETCESTGNMEQGTVTYTRMPPFSVLGR